MADIKKIRLSGQTYNIVDETAIHSLDGYLTSSQTQNAITAATDALAATIAEQGYQTATDVQNAISGKADSSAVTEEISAAVSVKADTSAVTEVSNALTAHTANTTVHITSAERTAWNAKADISDLSVYADAVKYDSNTKEVQFYHGGTGGTEVFSFDASPFLIDGMVSNVEIKDVTIGGESVTCLVISFNTDAGKQDINIPLSGIFDASNYYTTANTYSKTEVDTALGSKVDSSTYNTYTAATDSALEGKQATLVSGENIKTINNESILGSGNITIEQGTVDQTIVNGSTNAVAGGAVYDALEGKQATLVSQTNIKSVGGDTLLGSGNLAVLKASIGTGNDAETLILAYE